MFAEFSRCIGMMTPYEVYAVVARAKFRRIGPSHPPSGRSLAPSANSATPASAITSRVTTHNPSATPALARILFAPENGDFLASLVNFVQTRINTGQINPGAIPLTGNGLFVGAFIVIVTPLGVRLVAITSLSWLTQLLLLWSVFITAFSLMMTFLATLTAQLYRDIHDDESRVAASSAIA
jgi:hypothetical protein